MLSYYKIYHIKTHLSKSPILICYIQIYHKTCHSISCTHISSCHFSYVRFTTLNVNSIFSLYRISLSIHNLNLSHNVFWQSSDGHCLISTHFEYTLLISWEIKYWSNMYRLNHLTLRYLIVKTLRLPMFKKKTWLDYCTSSWFCRQMNRKPEFLSKVLFSQQS